MTLLASVKPKKATAARIAVFVFMVLALYVQKVWENASRLDRWYSPCDGNCNI